jgi:multidrug efflux pump subunit AcrA (membrane-fusion protein)
MGHSRRTRALIAALGIAGMVAGCARDDPADLARQLSAALQQSAPEQAQLYTVERGTVTRRIQVSSSIAPVDEARLYFRVGGRLRTLFVEEHQWVRAGAVLAELDMGDLPARVAEAQLNLDAARRRIARTGERARAEAEARAKLQLAEIRLQQAAAVDPVEDIRIAEAALQKAEIAVDLARLQGQTLKPAELDRQIAEADLETARKARESHLLEVEALEVQVELAKIELERTREYDDDDARTEIRLAELAVARLQDQVEAYRIRALRAGRVMSIAVLPGGEVAAYQPVIVVADPSTLEVVADLARAEVIQLRIDQPAKIELAEYPGRTLSGRVRRLPYVGLTGTDYLESVDHSTRIQFDRPRDMRLEVGDLARATIVLEEARDVLFLPPQALRIYQGRRFAVLVDGDRRTRVDVDLGIESEDRVEIRGGLKEGQVVVVQ